MSNIVFIIGALSVVLAVTIVIVQLKKSNKLIDSIEDMLNCAIRGEFVTGDYDESRLSKLESKLERFLDASSISAKNVSAEHDRMKELISDISHQTKTPIANLVLYSELLIDSDLSDDQKMNAKALQQQAEKLRFLIDSLVKLSRLENGILLLSPVRTEVEPVLNEVYDTYREKAENKGLKFSVNTVDASAFIDARWTVEAISNIVDNAIKYTPEGSIDISMQEYEMFVRIDIKDSGIGISEDEQAKVFGRFYRSVESKNSEGVGIGLFLARQIISGERGYIKLSSVLGKGTTFSVFLPKDEILQNC